MLSGVSLLSGDDHTLGVYLIAPGLYEFSASPIDGFGTMARSNQNKFDPTLCFVSGMSNRHMGRITCSMAGQAPGLTFRGRHILFMLFIYCICSFIFYLL
jgi:hypothetical protein